MTTSPLLKNVTPCSFQGVLLLPATKLRIWNLLDPHFGEQTAIENARSKGPDGDLIRLNGS